MLRLFWPRKCSFCAPTILLVNGAQTNERFTGPIQTGADTKALEVPLESWPTCALSRKTLVIIYLFSLTEPVLSRNLSLFIYLLLLCLF